MRIAIKMKCPAAEVAAVIALFIAASATVWPEPSAEEVFENFRETATSLKSYSYTVTRTDLGDSFVVERHKESMKVYDPILSKIELITRKNLDPEIRDEYRTETFYQFIAPFGMQAQLDVNQFLPPLLEGATAYFRPEINDQEIFFKEPLVGLVFRQPADTDSAAVMVANWTYDIIEAECALANGGGVSLSGTEEDGERTLYVLDIGLRAGEKEWKMGCGGNTYGVPETVFKQLDRELGMMKDRIGEYGSDGAAARYWIDSGNWLAVKKKVVFGDKVATEQEIKNIELNKVDTKKLLRPRRPKK